MSSVVRGGAATRSSRYPLRPRADNRCLPNSAPGACPQYDHRRRDPRCADTQRSLPETSEFRSYITLSTTDSTAPLLRCCAAKDRVAPVLDISLPGGRVCRPRDRAHPSAFRVCRRRQAERGPDGHRIFASDFRFRPGAAACGLRRHRTQFRENVPKWLLAAHSRIFAYQPSVDRSDVESHTRTVRKGMDACYAKAHVIAAIRATTRCRIAINERPVANSPRGGAASPAGFHRTHQPPGYVCR